MAQISEVVMELRNFVKCRIYGHASSRVCKLCMYLYIMRRKIRYQFRTEFGSNVATFHIYFQKKCFNIPSPPIYIQKFCLGKFQGSKSPTRDS